MNMCPVPRPVSVPTPHIGAAQGEIAEVVLMPGCPQRADLIAKTFLKDAVCVSKVRGINCWTGTYGGERVSVMASGMGCPSIGIYSYELFVGYNVKAIIRVGTCGSFQSKVAIGDLVIASGASYDGTYPSLCDLRYTFSPVADFDLLSCAVDAAKKDGVTHYVGNILSSDCFYSDDPTPDVYRRMGVLAVEMEAAALYTNAARVGKKALAICTASDDFQGGTPMTSEEREVKTMKMAEIAMKASVAFLKSESNH